MKHPKLFLLSVSCALPFMALFVSGLSIYLVNRNEIAFTLRDIALPLTGLFLALSLLNYFILWYFRRFTMVLKILAGLFVGLSLAVWVQSQLFVWNFGQFNGQGIVWNTWKPNMILESFVWAVIVGVSILIFMKGKTKVESALVLSIYSLGIASVLISAWNAPEKISSQTDESTYNDIFTFHPEKNVLIILLDDFQSDYFNYIVNNFPDEIKEMDGFTFYRNTISRFPTTKTSLPSIITGAIYRNEIRYDDYLRESYKSFNIIQAYKNKSYSTHFVGQLQNLFPDDISMETVDYKLNDSYFYPFLEYLDYGTFRALPTLLKPILYNRGNWSFTFRFREKYPPGFHGGDVRFLELFEKNARISSYRKGSFKFFHFFIPHAPWRVNENLQYDSTLSGEKGYIHQARGAIKLASRILKKLKQIGIYNNSEIIIMSDHGTGILSPIGRDNVYFDALNFVPYYVQSSSFALLLHKPEMSTGKMISSDVPLELTDLAYLLGVHNDDTMSGEYSLAKSGGNRHRTFYNYLWLQKDWNSDYLPPMTEYIVNGPALRPESYSLGNFIYTAKGREAIPSHASANDYSLGREIIFTTDGKGEADQYIRAGWSPPEVYQRWSVGPFAGLSFHLNEVPRKDLVLRILGFGYLANKKINCQVVTLIANKMPIGRWLVNEGKWYEAIIPHHIISDGTLNIVFKISNPMSPSEAEHSADSRKLGIGIVKLVIEQEK